MSLTTLQNFYKVTVARRVATTGALNIYVTALPTPSSGWLVISPSNTSLREIVKYSSTGTDANGTYVVISAAGDRGLGGTTAQTHEIGEPVRMNYTSLHHDELIAAIAAIGDVDGPSSSTDNAIARFDSTTGKVIQNSGIVVNDVVSKNAILSLANLATTDKTFTFPNETGTFALRGENTFVGAQHFDVNGDSGAGNGNLHIDNNSGPVRIQVYTPGTYVQHPLQFQATTFRLQGPSAASPGALTVGPINYAADAGGTDTYAITIDPTPIAYATGMQVIFKANTANTGAASLNVNGLGAKTIVKAVSTALSNNDILASMFCLCIYDGTNFVLMNPRTL